MNDSWIISGPLITGRSYFSNSGHKILLKKSLVSRNNTENFNERPRTTANELFRDTRRKIMTESRDKIRTNTQYGGFMANQLKMTTQNSSDMNHSSVNFSLKHQLSMQNKSQKSTIFYNETSTPIIEKSLKMKQINEVFPHVKSTQKAKHDENYSIISKAELREETDDIKRNTVTRFKTKNLVAMSHKSFIKPSQFRYTYTGNLGSAKNLNESTSGRHKNNNMSQIKHRYGSPSRVVRVGHLRRSQNINKHDCNNIIRELRLKLGK